MAGTKQELETLKAQWEETQPASGGFAPSDVPDGTYEFAIVKAEPNLNKYGLRITYRIVGGNDAFIGEEITVQDNLDTAQNMAWFKDRARRLGIPTEELLSGGKYADFDTILASSEDPNSIAAELVGKKFEGLKKHKGGFDNVYVNKLLGEADPSEVAKSEPAETEETTEQVAEAETTEGGLAEGSRVTFTSKADGDQAGTLVELFEDKGVQRARIDGDSGKRYNVSVDDAKVAAEGGEASETVEEVEETPKAAPKAANGNGKKVAVPKYPAVKALKPTDLRAFLAGYGIKAESLAKPREFVSGVAGLYHNSKYAPDLAELTALCAGLGVKKGAKPADTVKAVRAKVLAKFAH